MKSFSCFKPKDPFRNWSKELDKRLALWAKNFDSSFKLLLLGPAGAGKTTILKQMKIIHFEGFSLEERQQKAKEIRSNLLESVRELTSSITASGHEINWSDKENQARLEFMNGLNLDDQTYDLYAAKIYDYSKRILTDRGAAELFAQLNQLSITHRSQYLLNRVDEIRNANYIPNNDDILQSRRRTSDIQKLEFQVKLPVKSGSGVGSSVQQTFSMFDVGGQRGERRKWIQVFDGVSAVMFLIDSSSFDAIDEENGRNKLRETLNLFYEVWTTRFLLSSHFVLLFNKQDILREKIERGHKIEDHFPEYRLYKCSTSNQSSTSDRLGSIGRSADKLSLFRSSSGRSNSRQTSSSPVGLEKRKSSLSRLSMGALSRYSSSLSSAIKTPVSSPSTSARRQHLHHPERQVSTQQHTDNPPAGQQADKRQQSPKTRTASSEQAYIRARSFIRDKFLQITRQVDRDQRKFSMPTVMYNSKGNADQPIRTVCYHYTTATDTENIRDLFENLQKMVIKSSIKNSAR